MDKEGFSTRRAPLFNGSNYEFYRIRAKTYPMSLGLEVWNVVENGYTDQTTPPILPTAIKLSENNSKAKNEIMCGLEELVFVKVMHCVMSLI
jgi:hypothetical protein